MAAVGGGRPGATDAAAYSSVPDSFASRVSRSIPPAAGSRTAGLMFGRRCVDRHRGLSGGSIRLPRRKRISQTVRRVAVGPFCRAGRDADLCSYVCVARGIDRAGDALASGTCRTESFGVKGSATIRVRHRTWRVFESMAGGDVSQSRRLVPERVAVTWRGSPRKGLVHAPSPYAK